jgi:hypothetical protein
MKVISLVAVGGSTIARLFDQYAQHYASLTLLLVPEGTAPTVAQAPQPVLPRALGSSTSTHLLTCAHLIALVHCAFSVCPHVAVAKPSLTPRMRMGLVRQLGRCRRGSADKPAAEWKVGGVLTALLATHLLQSLVLQCCRVGLWSCKRVVLGPAASHRARAN